MYVLAYKPTVRSQYFAFHKVQHLFERYHIVQSVIYWTEVRINFFFQVTGRKPDIPCLYSRTRDDQLFYSFIF